MQAEFLAVKVLTWQHGASLPGHRLAADAGVFNHSCRNLQAAGVPAMQPGVCIEAAPSTTTACIAQPAACIQQRSALAQLNPWTASNVSDPSKQPPAPTTSAAAAPVATHIAPAGRPQLISEPMCCPATEADPADGERDAEQHATDADNSPTLVDVDTTTGGIQLHRWHQPCRAWHRLQQTSCAPGRPLCTCLPAYVMDNEAAA
jgi:hypothetical protein